MSPQFPLPIPRLGRLEKILFSLLALSIAVSLVERLGARSVPGSDVLRLAGYLAALVLLFKLSHMAVRRMLWRVRNRMILLFLFIGLVPLLLVTSLVGLAGYILIGQAAVFMATSELDRRAGRLDDTAAALVWNLAASDPAQRPRLADAYLERAAETWPGLEALILDSDKTIVYPSQEEIEPPQGRLRNRRRIVTREGRFYLAAHAPAGAPGASVSGPLARAAAGLEAVLLQPLDDSYLADLAPGLGDVRFWPWHGSREAARNAGAPPPKRAGRQTVSQGRGLLPEAAHRFDYEVVWGTAPFPVGLWGDGEQSMDVNILVHTRPSAVYRLLFGQRAEVAGTITSALIILGILFLIAELLSLVAGISITRTLTSSVHQLYEGTQKVNRGDFSHRVQISGHDQLAELSRSFNSMTESIERLIEESKERQRLASEIEIAREVQAQLFPKASPEMRGLEVLGVCNAARMVSGDYYDFVKVSDERLALAIGDVAGKGISGALLMASIQSMLRTQLSTTMARAETGGVWRFPTSDLVSQMNLQLYQNTAPEKYATFFFGAYDDRNGLLTYTNAGHLPPVLVRDGEARRLEVNGMVVGAFPFARYEQSEIELHPGDLLVAFTDGVTEPENEFAEEFGEDRLIELVVRNRHLAPRELIGEAIAAVGRWTGSPDLQDDMTMLVARRV